MNRLKIMRDGIPIAKSADRVSVVQAPPGNMAGSIEWDPKNGLITGATLPVGDNAFQRTVRYHELLHANHTPQALHKLCKKYQKANDRQGWSSVQTIEDVFVQAVYWPRKSTQQQNRDALCVAMQEARGLLHNHVDPRQYNDALRSTLRAMAIAYTCAPLASTLWKDEWDKMTKAVVKAFGSGIFNALYQIIQNVQYAIGRSEPAQQKIRLRAIKDLDLLYLDPPKPDFKGKPLAPEHAPSAEPMKIVHLPLAESCTDKSSGMRLTRSGARINVGRLATCVVNNTMAGLFRKRIPRNPQGTVVFDASGSMGISPDFLRQLCKAAPGAQVAYYSGSEGEMLHHAESFGPGGYGALVIWAKEGRRYGGNKCPYKYGGNEVDLFAIRWLLQQQAPRIIVTDRGFCGGPMGQSATALAVLEFAEKQGLVRVIDGARQALAEFSKKRR